MPRQIRFVLSIKDVVGYPFKAVVNATKFAVAYQRAFRKDVFVDMICYRRHGHNELDDPTFTNPVLYKVIHNTRTVPDKYADQLMEEGANRT